MLALVGQTAEPNWLELFEKTHGYRAKTNQIFCSKIDFFHSNLFLKLILKNVLRATPGSSASYIFSISKISFLLNLIVETVLNV